MGHLSDNYKKNGMQKVTNQMPITIKMGYYTSWYKLLFYNTLNTLQFQVKNIQNPLPNSLLVSSLRCRRCGLLFSPRG